MNTPHAATARFNFDFGSDWDWNQLIARAEKQATHNTVNQLTDMLSIEDARFLLGQLARLDDPAEIGSLQDYGQLQIEWGGSFHGMLPSPLGDREIAIPADFDSLVACALTLAQARMDNISALKKAIPSYPIQFKQDAFPKLQTMTYPAGWSFTLNLSAIERVLDLFCNGSEASRNVESTVAEIASLPAFAEMIRHRRELGYIPEPLITRDGLASFIQHAASHAPVDMLWKWLTPENLFDLADLFMNQGNYRQLIETIGAHRHEITTHILGTIARFAPPKTVFNDRLAFAIGWGIAGWATDITGGINIEHFKDDYNRLLLTLTHETFHRFQLHVCPSDPESVSDQRSFETIASFPFALDLDRKFYEVLTYIFLEGTATYVAAAHPPANREESIRQGRDLLSEAFSAIYTDRNTDRAEEILNNGLKSNGPFYWLGARIAESIVENGGDEALADALIAGAPAFFAEGLALDRSSDSPAQARIVAKAQELAEIMRGT